MKKSISLSEACDLIELYIQGMVARNLSFKSISLLEKLVKEKLKTVNKDELFTYCDRNLATYEHLLTIQKQ